MKWKANIALRIVGFFWLPNEGSLSGQWILATHSNTYIFAIEADNGRTNLQVVQRSQNGNSMREEGDSPSKLWRSVVIGKNFTRQRTKLYLAHCCTIFCKVDSGFWTSCVIMNKSQKKIWLRKIVQLHTYYYVTNIFYVEGSHSNFILYFRSVL